MILFLQMFALDQQTLITVALSALVISVLASLFLLFLAYRIFRLTRGKNSESLEEVIGSINERTSALEVHARGVDQMLTVHTSKIQRSVQTIATKRFDPFQNAGGQQSFASALVNERGDGVIISGFHARDGVRVYAKEVEKFASSRDLSDEEKDALQTARASLQ